MDRDGKLRPRLCHEHRAAWWCCVAPFRVMRGNRRGKTDGRPGESEIDRIENIEDLNPHEMTFIQYPKPPKAVSCHFGCYDCIATIWWDYNINEADGEISWEVRRYRLDVISKTYSPKGIQIYKDIVPRKVVVAHCIDLISP